MDVSIVVPALVRQTATVIFMHGRGDTGHGWAQTMHMIRTPYVKCICPTAPVIPVTMADGFRMHSWFDMFGLPPATDKEDEAGIRAAAKSVHALIEREIECGTPSKRILLGGFSQGGALALIAGLTFEQPLAGIAALSTFLPLRREFPACCSSANKDVHIFHCHGGSDVHLTPAVADVAAKTLRELNGNYRLKIYPDLAHSSSLEELNDLKRFIEERLPPI